MTRATQINQARISIARQGGRLVRAVMSGAWRPPTLLFLETMGVFIPTMHATTEYAGIINKIVGASKTNERSQFVQSVSLLGTQYKFSNLLLDTAQRNRARYDAMTEPERVALFPSQDAYLALTHMDCVVSLLMHWTAYCLLCPHSEKRSLAEQEAVRRRLLEEKQALLDAHHVLDPRSITARLEELSEWWRHLQAIEYHLANLARKGDPHLLNQEISVNDDTPECRRALGALEDVYWVAKKLLKAKPYGLVCGVVNDATDSRFAFTKDRLRRTELLLAKQGDLEQRQKQRSRRRRRRLKPR
jgi:hypothetical protein